MNIVFARGGPLTVEISSRLRVQSAERADSGGGLRGWTRDSGNRFLARNAHRSPIESRVRSTLGN